MSTVRAFAAIACFILLIANCGESSNNNDANRSDTGLSNQEDTTRSGSFSYDAAKDGMVTGAEFSKKLGDTLGIKFYEMTLKPGDSATLHSHPAHTVYVLQGGQLAVYFDGTNRQVMDLVPGMGFVGGPVNDAAKNIGKTTIKMVIADVYR